MKDNYSLIEAVERYYTAKITAHGATPLGVDWNGAHGQTVRFERLLEVLDDADTELSINDFGCGYGGLFDLLASRLDRFEYRGYDVSGAMIDAAQDRYGSDPRASFLNDERELQVADFTVASGIFNVCVHQSEDVWRRYMLATIDKLASISRRGMAFNALTLHSDPELMSPDLYYADPAAVLDYCLRRHTRDVALHHDYELYEFTVVARLDGRRPAAQIIGGAQHE
jgi:SAM-dependent methyltransferase